MEQVLSEAQPHSPNGDIQQGVGVGTPRGASVVFLYANQNGDWMLLPYFRCYCSEGGLSVVQAGLKLNL